MKTTKECLERLESKIDEIRQDLQAIHELIAKNEAEHQNFEHNIEKLHEFTQKKEGDTLKALAWISMVTGLLLTIVNLLQKL